MRDPALTVYEVVNETFRELVVGVTERTMAGLIASHRFHRPEPLAGWLGQPRYCSVEFGLTRQEAVEYARRWAQTRSREGWRVSSLS